MSNKMLIDASHPEETRVAVVRGNRIEEYDFESQEKKQLRGNIYLAKVTRVEPSLQAAFIDYGGNRHGFLAFSEIHPDYYQIPVADRQALLEAEAAEARAARESEEANDDIEAIESEDDASEEVAAEKPEKEKKKPRRRRSKKAEAANDVDAEADSGEDAGNEIADATDETPKAEPVAKDTNTDSSEEAVDGESEKPKKRTTRRRTSRKKADAEKTTSDSTEAQSDNDDDIGTSDGDDKPTTMAAVIETDSISEPLPEDEGADREPEDNGDDQAEATSEEVEAPKKRRTSRSRRKPKKEEEAATTEAETAGSDEAGEAAGDDADDSTDDGEEKPAKRKRRPRRRSRAKKDAPDQDDEENEDENGSSEDADASVESVGQEDALEEVPAPRRARRHYKIQEVIKRRQVLLVQVVKEERGTKGAALTTYLSLAGRYSVLMPNTARGGGISRKITNSADRKRLKAIAEELEVPNGMGVILRTAGASRTKDEINRDFEYLMRLWGQVRNLTLSSTAPCLVYEEGSLIKRSIRDLYDKDTGEIIVSGAAGYEEAKDFMTMLMPSHADKVKLHKDGQSIFAKYGVESHMEKMLSPQVTLKSGGYLIINQTEALVAVDVNSGRATREHSVEDTALQTNLEAAEEVARQLRLRDLAGLIVIDFIDMEERRNNRAVEKKLKECLKNDRARIQVGRISHFGLLEMSRQRMRASVLESTMDVCPHCAGTGYVRSDSAIALHVFRAIEEHVSRHNRFDCVVKTNPSIAIHILNYKRAALWALEEKYGLHVIIEGDPEVQGQEFVIEKGERAQEQSGAAAIGYQGDSEEASDEAATAKDDNDGEGGKKRRNRRRRRKNRDEDRDDNNAIADTSEDEEVSESKGGTPPEEDDSGKKRGRGRNTRRAKSDEKSDENKAEAGDNSQAEQVPTADVKAAPSEEQEKPKRRSTVRRKAPVTPKPEAEADAKLEETKTEAKSEEPPRPTRRRTTRRKPVTQASAEASESEQSNGTSEAPDQVTENAEDGAKKAGWWQRGGGFF